MLDRIRLTTHAKLRGTVSQFLKLNYFSEILIPVYHEKSQPPGRPFRVGSSLCPFIFERLLWG
jgi:hypothetical protein